MYTIRGLIALVIVICNPATAQMPRSYGVLDINGAIEALPDSNHEAIIDNLMLDNGEVGVRVIRVYQPVPLHSHAFSSTYLYIVSGRAVLSIEDGDSFVAAAGNVLFWERGINHRIVRIEEHSFTLLAIDAPARRDDDVHDPEVSN